MIFIYVSRKDFVVSIYLRPKIEKNNTTKCSFVMHGLFGIFYSALRIFYSAFHDIGKYYLTGIRSVPIIQVHIEEQKLFFDGYKG